MSYERSVGAIIFRHGSPPRAELGIDAPIEDAGTTYVLLLRYRGRTGGHWDFARGHVEEGEREQVTAIREIGEETAITTLEFLPGFRERYRYRFHRESGPVTKDAIMYLAETTASTVRLSDEHLGFAWFPLADALRHLTYENSRAVLRKARVFLQQRARGVQPAALAAKGGTHPSRRRHRRPHQPLRSNGAASH